MHFKICVCMYYCSNYSTKIELRNHTTIHAYDDTFFFFFWLLPNFETWAYHAPSSIMSKCCLLPTCHLRTLILVNPYFILLYWYIPCRFNSILIESWNELHTSKVCIEFSLLSLFYVLWVGLFPLLNLEFAI